MSDASLVAVEVVLQSEVSNVRYDVTGLHITADGLNCFLFKIMAVLCRDYVAEI